MTDSVRFGARVPQTIYPTKNKLGNTLRLRIRQRPTKISTTAEAAAATAVTVVSSLRVRTRINTAICMRTAEHTSVGDTQSLRAKVDAHKCRYANCTCM